MNDQRMQAGEEQEKQRLKVGDELNKLKAERDEEASAACRYSTTRKAA